MEGVRRFEGLCAALPRRDVDTDQIIPKQFLKRTGREGYGDACFFDWRYLPDGRPRPEFELNDPAYRGASILVSGANFGCGSSREHAVWALRGMGFRAVVAASFGDIFRANSLQNGLLPVQLSEVQADAIAARSVERRGYRLLIDLEAQTVSDRDGEICGFAIDPFWKECLTLGRDPLELALDHAADISSHELRRAAWLPRCSELAGLT